jgi:hypothetical protein
MRHGYWAVSLSSDRTKHPHEPLDSRPSLWICSWKNYFEPLGTIFTMHCNRMNNFFPST